MLKSLKYQKILQRAAFEKKRSSIEDTLKKLYMETDSLWEKLRVRAKIKEIFNHQCCL